MATQSVTTQVVPFIPLEYDLDLFSEQGIHVERQLKCHGKTLKGKRCRNLLRKRVRIDLLEIVPSISTKAEAGEEVKELLQKLSRLIFCRRWHQKLAIAQCEIWSTKLEAWKLQNIQRKEVVEEISVLVDTSDLPTDGETIPVPYIKEEDTTTPSNPQTAPQNPCSASSPVSCASPSEDKHGNGTGDEKEKDSSEQARQVKMAPYGDPATVTDSVPTTSKRSPKVVRADSAISGIYGLRSPNAEASSGLREEPPSPLANKPRRKPRTGASKVPSRPAPTPIQPASSPAEETPYDGSTPGSERRFKPYSPWRHWKNSEELMAYIKKPFQINRSNPLVGCVYAFKVPDCSLIKIGYSGKRKGRSVEASLKASMTERMREHRRCGWGHLEVLFHEEVAFPSRLEKLIHRHLALVRQKEVEMEEGSNDRVCRHKEHREWFAVSTKRARRVVQAWKRWSQTDPYSVDGKNIALNKEWKANLARVNIRSDDDHWLEWLDQEVPDSSVPFGERDFNVSINLTDDVFGEYGAILDVFTLTPLREEGEFKVPIRGPPPVSKEKYWQNIAASKVNKTESKAELVPLQRKEPDKP